MICKNYYLLGWSILYICIVILLEDMFYLWNMFKIYVEN